MLAASGLVETASGWSGWSVEVEPFGFERFLPVAVLFGVVVLVMPGVRLTKMTINRAGEVDLDGAEAYLP